MKKVILAIGGVLFAQLGFAQITNQDRQIHTLSLDI